VAETSRNREISQSAGKLAVHQKPIFLWVDGMRLQFHSVFASQGKYPLQAVRRLERR